MLLAVAYPFQACDTYNKRDRTIATKTLCNSARSKLCFFSWLSNNNNNNNNYKQFSRRWICAPLFILFRIFRWLFFLSRRISFESRFWSFWWTSNPYLLCCYVADFFLSFSQCHLFCLLPSLHSLFVSLPAASYFFSNYPLFSCIISVSMYFVTIFLFCSCSRSYVCTLLALMFVRFSLLCLYASRSYVCTLLAPMFVRFSLLCLYASRSYVCTLLLSQCLFVQSVYCSSVY